MWLHQSPQQQKPLKYKQTKGTDAGVLGNGFNLTAQSSNPGRLFLLQLQSLPSWNLPASAPHKYNCFQLSKMSQLRKPVLWYLVTSEVTCFWGVLKYTPTLGTTKQLHKLERQGTEKAAFCINYSNTMSQGDRSRGRRPIPHSTYPMLATTSKATDEFSFIETKSPTLSALQWLRPSASQSPHSPLKLG